MRAASFCLAALAFGCGQVGSVQDGGVDVSSRSTALQMPLTTVTITEDCDGGGTVQLTGSLDIVETPAKVDLGLSFTYTACVTDKYGTVAGTAASASSYAPWVINLTYSGTRTGTCTANFALSDVGAEKPVDKLSVAGSCQHPYVKYLEKLEKECKLKKPKAGHGPSKSKCSLF